MVSDMQEEEEEEEAGCTRELQDKLFAFSYLQVHRNTQTLSSLQVIVVEKILEVCGEKRQKRRLAVSQNSYILQLIMQYIFMS